MIEHIAVHMRQVRAKYADKTATRIRVGDEWVTQTFAEFGRRIDGVAQGLLDLGIEAEDRIGLFANNCPEWSEIDFGSSRQQ